MTTYEDSGVSLARGDAASEDAKEQIKATFTKEVVLDHGIPCTSLKSIFPEILGDHLLSRTTDGVGTKLIYAAAAGRFRTPGRDLVAMVVDDMGRYNRKAKGFSMYRSSNKIVEEHFHEMVEGAVEGCKEAGVPYLSGETAEMPDFYAGFNYEIVGFADGIHERGTLRFGQGTEVGDILLALPSYGGGSNGYSFLRKIWSPEQVVSGNAPVTIDDILKPTPIYNRPILEVMSYFPTIRGWAHITGGGLGERGKLPQILPTGLAAQLRTGSWETSDIFVKAQQTSGASDEEMRSTFNMGLMMVSAVSDVEAMPVFRALEELGCEPLIVGEVVLHNPGEKKVIFN